MSIKEYACELNAMDDKINSTMIALFLFMLLPLSVILLCDVSTGASIITSTNDATSMITITVKLVETSSANLIPLTHIAKVITKHFKQVSA